MDVLEQLMPKIGDLIGGRYRIESVLGEGGFGVVYIGRQENLDRQVAIKMLLPAALSDRTAVARFQREVDMVRHLEHPNTVRIFDRGETDHQLQFYVMELVRGDTLADVLSKDGPLPPPRVKRITEQVLMSLGEAHSHDIIHRDLKPGNIMLTEVFGKTDHVKVLDFGIGKVIGGGESAGGLTTQGLIGTPYYMSPEQAKAQADIDGRSDLYALGLIMHEILTRRRAIDGPSPLEVVMNHVRPEPVKLDPFVSSGHLGHVIIKATAKDRDARFASAQDMLNALQSTDVPQSVRAYPPGQAHGPNLAGTPRTPGSMPLSVGSAQATAETMMAPNTPMVAPQSLATPTPAPAPATAPTPAGASKSLIILAILFLAVAAGVFFLIRSGTNDQQAQQTDAEQPTDPDAHLDEPAELDAGVAVVSQDTGTASADITANDVTGPNVVINDTGGAIATADDVASGEPTVSALALVSGSAQALQRQRQAISHMLLQTATLVGTAVEAGSNSATLAAQQAIETEATLAANAQADTGSEPDAGTDEDAQLALVEEVVEEEIAEEEGITVEIRGSPSNARVRVDGETVCRRLPCEVTLPPGEGSVRARVSASDHMSETIRLRRVPGRVHRVELWRTFD